jgi:hypothetical protein
MAFTWLSVGIFFLTKPPFLGSLIFGGTGFSNDSIFSSSIKQLKTFRIPEWEKFGKSAGVKRNKEIVSNSDFVILFQKGNSKGTQSSLNLCKKLGVNYKLFKF